LRDQPLGRAHALVPEDGQLGDGQGRAVEGEQQRRVSQGHTAIGLRGFDQVLDLLVFDDGWFCHAQVMPQRFVRITEDFGPDQLEDGLAGRSDVGHKGKLDDTRSRCPKKSPSMSWGYKPIAVARSAPAQGGKSGEAEASLKLCTDSSPTREN
jgi:hypothetical protein